jgi:hypothetical protein
VHGKHVLYPSAYLRLIAVLRALRLIDFVTAVTHMLIGEILCFVSFACDEALLTRLCAVTVHTLFLAMQQIG